MKYSLFNVYRFIILSVIWLLFSVNAIAQEWIYTVVEGDNLWNLSEKHLDKVTRFEQLRRLNAIENPRHMQPGTRIRVPLEWIRSNPAAAKIISFTGTASLQRAKKSLSDIVSVGTMLHLGDQLKTGANSSIAIEFADKSILTLHENSLIHFDHLSAHGVTGMVDSRLNLLQGRMDTKVTPAVGPGSRFEIETPSAISAVRGTVYRASVLKEGTASNIEVLRGKVAVSGGNKQLMVNKGYGTQVSAGSPPLPPRELLPAPTFDAIPNEITQINQRISWSKIDGAAGYRVEVATDDNFETLLWQGLSQYNHIAIPDLPDGEYAVRVRALDPLSLEGINQAATILLNAHPQPPLALKPLDSQIFRGEAPTLQWTAASEADNYRLEIASDREFIQQVFDKNGLADTNYQAMSVPKIGHYFWRLSSISADGEIGPVGPVRSYEIKAIPDKVNAAVAMEDDGLLVASWNSASSKQRFQLQIASDKEFTDIITDETVNEPKYAFEPFKDEPRYLRVKSIEQDGYEGPWGSTQMIEPLPKEPVNYWPLGIWTIFTILLI